MSLADPLNPAHRGDELVAEQQFASTLEAELTAARSEHDALSAERDQLISSLNLEKGAATLLLAERDRLASQCETLRAERDEARLECQRFRQALHRISSWTEGATVTSSFDEPHSARIAREAMSGAESTDALECEALRSQLATLRALLADLRPAIVARLATDPLGLDDSLLPRIDAAIA